MARFDYNPLTNQLDLVDSPAGYINGVVDDPTLLPVTLGTPALDSVYLAKAGSGVWLINRKPAGLYCRVANNGDLDDWQYLGAFPEVNADGNWALYNSADPTKELKFDVSNLTTGTTRTLTVPDKSGTLATTDASDLTTGTLAAARLSSNVPLKDASNTYTQNQTLDGTNNVAPNQTAASGSSLMTRTLTSEEPFFSLGYVYRPGTFAYGNSGTGSSASVIAGDFRIAQASSGTATSGFGRVTISRGFHTVPAYTGGGVGFGTHRMGCAIRFFWNQISLTANDGRARLIFGGNASTPATADNNALSVVGFGWELRNTATAQEWRLFAHDGTNYSAGSWNSITPLTRAYYISVSSNGNGTISGYFAVDGSRTFTTDTLSGGPTTNSTSANSHLDLVSVNSSTGTPSNIAFGIGDVQLLTQVK